MADLLRQALHDRPQLTRHKISSCVEDHTYLVLDILGNVILDSSIIKDLNIRISALQLQFTLQSFNPLRTNQFGLRKSDEQE
jgi:hypothetical protein